MVVLKYCVFLGILFVLTSFADSSPVLIKLDNTKGHNNPIGAYYDRRCGIYRTFQGGGRAIHVNYDKRCPNNFIGLKAHDEQSQYYYECKKDLVVFGRCPYLHVFDKISNKCRYQRYVDLDVDIVPAKCTKEGKFPVKTNCSLYYICNKNGKEFRTQVFRCPGSSIYSPDTRRCSQTGTCSPSTVIYDDSIKCPEVYELSFPGCSEQGMYRSRNDCSLYYNCSFSNDFGFIETRYMCPEGKAFSIDHNTCLPRSNVLCKGDGVKDYDFGDDSYIDLDDYDNETKGCDDDEYNEEDNMVGSKLTTTTREAETTTTTEEGSGDTTTKTGEVVSSTESTTTSTTTEDITTTTEDIITTTQSPPTTTTEDITTTTEEITTTSSTTTTQSPTTTTEDITTTTEDFTTTPTTQSPTTTTEDIITTTEDITTTPSTSTTTKSPTTITEDITTSTEDITTTPPATTEDITTTTEDITTTPSTTEDITTTPSITEDITTTPSTSTTDDITTTPEIETTTQDIETTSTTGSTSETTTPEEETTSPEVITTPETVNTDETTETTSTTESTSTTTTETTPTSTVTSTSTEITTLKPNTTCVHVISHCTGYNNCQDPDHDKDPDVSLVPENQSPVGTVVVNVPQHPVDIIFRFRPKNKTKGLSVDFFHGKYVGDKPCVVQQT